MKERGIEMKKAISIICCLVFALSFSVTASASVESVPYSNTIVYDSSGRVDAQYYEDMQYKLIKELEDKAKGLGERTKVNQSAITPASLSSVAPGDVFVSFTGTTSGIDFALVGHASLAETSGGVWAISSWPESKSPSGINGVQYEYRYWDNLSKIYALRVKGSTASTRSNAVNNAINIVSRSPRPPYNWFFLNKFTTSSFYCSQLVWRAWYDAGVNIDRFPYDTVVSPAELTGDHMEVLYYRN